LIVTSSLIDRVRDYLTIPFLPKPRRWSSQARAAPGSGMHPPAAPKWPMWPIP